MRAAALVARRKSAVAIGALPISERVAQAWPAELAATIAGMKAERERCAGIVESLIGESNGPETDAMLVTAAEAIRSGNNYND
ncbi:MULTISPECIES: hypothetical protein [Sphingosinicellaceae]|uniref:hypothetical protein n=1 Tax=Sphingosinicellaceae TaxID=2820280 RepID=UPI001C1DD131|nr:MULTISPECIES: hypothetical protein [Polymorphobacter]QYE33070.1 hypothetical protein KZX46_02780 [Polymorphobacter sp. PAMC 29334]UAJ12289.1 hypothetical protein KTC28_20930 [Polymorphobacter megasporae]